MYRSRSAFRFVPIDPSSLESSPAATGVSSNLNADYDHIATLCSVPLNAGSTATGSQTNPQNPRVDVPAPQSVTSYSTTNPPSSSIEPQLQSYSYAVNSLCGDNVVTAWRYGTGSGTTVSLIDDGFNPTVTAQFTNFDASQSINFGSGGANNIGEPSGDVHGTTTAAEIGGSGTSDQPVGIAPKAAIIGVKVSFTICSPLEMSSALTYASMVSDVVNNSWGYCGFGIGEPEDDGFVSWYNAVANAVQTERSGLGTVIVFASGNDRAEGDDIGLQPTVSDPRVIAVAASDIYGNIASYSDPGAGLLVAALGNNALVPASSGVGTTYASGTSYAAPLVSGIVSLMLAANPDLGWRDVQEILADSAYAPAASSAGFTTNHAPTWNGGGMHFSDNFGFGVVDANVAVNLARTWNEQSTSANLIVGTSSYVAAFTTPSDTKTNSYLSFTADLRIQHVQVTINDDDLLAADTSLVLVSPAGTQSVLLDDPGQVGSTDNTDGLDLDGCVITSNAFWGEDSPGVWTLEAVDDSSGKVVAKITNWSLTVWGDDASTVTPPLVYTPEFAELAGADPARTVVSVQGSNANTIDLIALPGTTTINLNGGAGMIDGIAVTVASGLRNANADGSTGSVTLTGLTSGGSELSGGDGTTVITGVCNDVINAGLGTTTINTGKGGSTITLSSLGASTVTITSGGGDTINAGLANVAVKDVGINGDTISAGSANLTFINGSGASLIEISTGSILIQGGYSSTAVSVQSTGTDQETIVAGGVSDLITIQAGSTNGLDLIKDFRVGIDHLQLEGYTTDPVTLALQDQTSDGAGGILFTLPDGMRIDLAGVGHITQTAFV